MHDGVMSFGDTTLFNKEQTGAYVRRFLPRITIKCDQYTGLHNALGKPAYVDPATDLAPWFRSNVPATRDFYGFYPMLVDGIENSTRTTTVTELAGDGAIHALPRYGSKEIRVRGLMFAKNDAGMSAGMSWLRSVLDDRPCGSEGVDCEGRVLEFFTANPAAATEALALPLVAEYGRIMYRVETLDAPRKTAELPSQSAVLWEVEFILNSGVPWQFTYPDPVATTTGLTPVTTNETFCPTQDDAYDLLVTDPLQPTVERPPRPPLIEPAPMPANWSRYTTTIGLDYGQRAGRLVPTIRVQTGAAEDRKIRVRFYRIDNTGPCDYEGEFYITYVPANATLVIDGTQKTMMVTMAGEERPAGNLIIGSDGRPPKWPSMACNSSYQVVVDSDDPLGETLVLTDLSIRE